MCNVMQIIGYKSVQIYKNSPLDFSVYYKKGEFLNICTSREKVLGYITRSIFHHNPLSVQEYTPDYW